MPGLASSSRASILNFAEIVHGGMLATLADQAMGMTALRASGNKPHATIELNMQFIDAVRLNEFVEAHCEVVRLTRAIIFMQCKRRHALGGERDGDLEDTRRSVSGPHLDPPPLRGRKAITSSRSLQGGSGWGSGWRRNLSSVPPFITEPGSG